MADRRPGRPRFRRVLVLTGDHALPDPTKWEGKYDDEDLAFHARMREALRSLPGYEVDFLTEHARLVERITSDPPEFVLNLCDTGFNNVATQELHVPALLELHGIPYSGAPPAAMAICYDKAIVRLVAEAHGIPTPHEAYVRPDASLDDVDFDYPALIKPNQGDGSVGITRDALVRTPAEARRYLEWLRRELPGVAALVQEYLPGPEYGLALIGNPGTGFTALPPLVVDFSALPGDVAPILSFESKTAPDSPYSKVEIKRAELAEAELGTMRRSAELMFERLQCRDYARFDFRAGADGVLKLMEVNPNPAWSSAAKLALMASFAGISYPELLGLILEAAQARWAAGSAS